MIDTLTPLKAVAMGLVLFGTMPLVNSQDAGEVISQEATAITLPAELEGAQSPEERLAAIRTLNTQLLEKQKASLLKLEKIEKEAEQLRIFARRS